VVEAVISRGFLLVAVSTIRPDPGLSTAFPGDDQTPTATMLSNACMSPWAAGHAQWEHRNIACLTEDLGFTGPPPDRSSLLTTVCTGPVRAEKRVSDLLAHSCRRGPARGPRVVRRDGPVTEVVDLGWSRSLPSAAARANERG
jgi:hypothetical protein